MRNNLNAESLSSPYILRVPYTTHDSNNRPPPQFFIATLAPPERYL